MRVDCSFLLWAPAYIEAHVLYTYEYGRKHTNADPYKEGVLCINYL